MRAKQVINDSMIYAALILLSLIAIFPVVWMILTSFKLRAFSPELLSTLTLNNYYTVFARSPMPLYLKNSIIVALISTSLTMIVGVPAGYSLARFRVGGHHLPFWILSTRMMPPIATVIPIFLIFRSLGLLDTPLALIFPYLIFQLPLAVWLARGFIQDVPVALEEAAMVGGCSRFTAFTRIVLPLIAPGLAATAILCIIFSWGEFLLALILTGTTAKTVPVAAMSYITEVGIQWGEIAATGSVIMFPVILFVIVVQRYLIRGLTFGAVKG